MKVVIASLVSALLLGVGFVSGQESSHLRSRRLSDHLDPKSVIQKELSTKGYVCEIGDPHWSHDHLLKHMDSFVAAWNERKQVFATIDKSTTNAGGNGLYHAFILWATIKNLKPTLIVESGVHMGATSWLIAKASEEWGATMGFVDPQKFGWEQTTAPGRTVHDYRGTEKFKDFTEIPWDSIQADRSNALVFFDDHMDQLRRLQEAQKLGFGHVMFDDNYIAGTGDIFSIKSACDGRGAIREIFAPPNHPIQRCDMFHHECKPMTPEQGEKADFNLKALTEILWEGPPLTELFQAYSDVKNFAMGGLYEGPNPWIKEVHDRLVRESTKEPLFTNAEEVAKKFGLQTHELYQESGRYMNIVYIKLKTGPVTLSE